MRLLSLILLLLAGCSGETNYTLYRGSVTADKMRIHIATFDSKDGEKYNGENCELARELFQSQPGVKVRFWCEKGPYKS